jgi:hypothetical protein
MRAAAVNRIGVANLDAANEGRHVNGAARFASGGYVGAAAGSSVSSGGGTNVQVSVSTGGSTSFDKDDASWLRNQVQALVDTRIDKKMKGQGGYAWKQKYGSVG